MAEDNQKRKREAWGSRLGIVLAVAGSAVGLGNFLRFPVQAASNGGGAFMIPYFISLLLLGIPLMWVEWTLGRYGGGFEHSTAPGIFHTMSRKARFVKYFGIIGIFGPVVIFMYYTYIESWLLGFSFFSITGKYAEVTGKEEMQGFLQAYQGLVKNNHFSSLLPAYIFFLITFAINMIVVSFGVRGGIEKLCKIAMPLLLGLGIVILIRVLTLSAPDAAKPEWNVMNGLGFMWNPDFAALKNAKVWLAAAGQIFFTLSVGIGCILTYASYLSKEDDVVLSGLTSVSVNEFSEVILGGSIIIPAAFIFFGAAGVQTVAQEGAFNLGFVTMPLIFKQIPLGGIFIFIWFFLLFVAGVTSSVSMLQPAIAFIEDEFDISRKKAIGILWGALFILCQPAVFFLKHGVVDELDFWAGTFCLVLFATVEVILFAWVYGIDRSWDEMHLGAELRVPRIYRFIIKYITPSFLLIILGFWFVQQGLPTILMRSVPTENQVYVLTTRLGLVCLFLVLMVCLKIAWSRKRKRGVEI
ncbi:MAG: sodium-dependent transporter [Candidatus Omnitrophica bacterium]|nr:sodium-dependent transporter [Candidatus Omnitrophota bacterium]